METVVAKQLHTFPNDNNLLFVFFCSHHGAETALGVVNDLLGSDADDCSQLIMMMMMMAPPRSKLRI